MPKTVYLQSYGCQMNERDSEEVLGMLPAPAFARGGPGPAQGYEVAERPEAGLEDRS